MSNYINREELLKNHIHFVKGEEFNLNRLVGVVKTKDILNMPSVDAVEVVRCKDCKHFKETSETKGECNYWKVLPPIYPFKEDYCERGEKE